MGKIDTSFKRCFLFWIFWNRLEDRDVKIKRIIRQTIKLVILLTSPHMEGSSLLAERAQGRKPKDLSRSASPKISRVICVVNYMR